jgi:hypothetical protein
MLISFQKLTLLASESKLLSFSLSKFKSPAFFLASLSLKLFSIYDKFGTMLSRAISLIYYFFILSSSISFNFSNYNSFISLAYAIFSIFKSSYINIPYPSLIASYSIRFIFFFRLYFLASIFFLIYSFFSSSIILISIFAVSRF